MSFGFGGFLASEWGCRFHFPVQVSWCLGYPQHRNKLQPLCLLSPSFSLFTHTCFVLSLITCFCKLFFLHVLGVTRLFGLRSWDFKCCFFPAFNGPLSIHPVNLNSAESNRRVQYWSDLKSQVKLVMKCSIKKQLLQWGPGTTVLTTPPSSIPVGFETWLLSSPDLSHWFEWNCLNSMRGWSWRLVLSALLSKLIAELALELIAELWTQVSCAKFFCVLEWEDGSW